jgi:hypothetical protein
MFIKLFQKIIVIFNKFIIKKQSISRVTILASPKIVPIFLFWAAFNKGAATRTLLLLLLF